MDLIKVMETFPNARGVYCVPRASKGQGPLNVRIVRVQMSKVE